MTTTIDQQLPETTANTRHSAVRRFTAAIGTVVGAAAALAVTAQPVAAAPVCALRMSISTGADDLRPHSSFSAGLIVKDATKAGGFRYVALHTSGELNFGAAGLAPRSTQTFYVAPYGASNAGSTCPDARNVVGAYLTFHADMDAWGFDQWDNAGVSIVDSVNPAVFQFNSTVNVHYKWDEPSWKRTNLDPSAPWSRF